MSGGGFWALLLAAIFAATAAWLWLRAAPLFTAIQAKARAGGVVIVDTVDEANANAWASAATIEQGTRRIRLVAAACGVTALVLAWLGVSA